MNYQNRKNIMIKVYIHVTLQFNQSCCCLPRADQADIGACQFQVHKENWTVVGSCDVTKVYSSAANYGCKFDQRHKKVSLLLVYPRTPSPPCIITSPSFFPIIFLFFLIFVLFWNLPFYWYNEHSLPLLFPAMQTTKNCSNQSFIFLVNQIYQPNSQSATSEL